MLRSIHGGLNNGDSEFDQMVAVITVTSGADGTKVYWDHWEDTYDFNPANPDATSDITPITLNRGESFVFQSSTIPANPRGTSTHFDGGDRIFTAGRVTTVTKAGWGVNPGTVAAYAWELYPIRGHDTSYRVPVGQNMAGGPKNYTDFSAMHVLVMSTQDGNDICIDDTGTGAAGSCEVRQVINRGAVLTRSNTLGTTRVVSMNSPARTFQVVFVGGTQNSQHNRRTLNVPPIALFGNDYVSPVPGFAGGFDTDLFVFNHNTSGSISVNYTDTVGTGSFSVPAGDTRSYQEATGRFVPVDSPVRLTSTSNFWAFGAGDTESTGFDWTFNLVQTPYLQEDVSIGWAPGARDGGDAGTQPDGNGSPLYISPVNDGTYVFVDFSPANGVDDQVFVLDRGQTVKVYDPDFDNTATQVQSIGPVAITFGEDPSVAGTGDPFLDLGYSHPPLLDPWIDPVLRVDHVAAPATLPATGGTTGFTITATSFAYPIAGVDVTEQMPAGWAYVPGSTTITLPGGAGTITGPAANPTVGTNGLLTWDLNQAMGTSQTLTINFSVATTSATQFGPNRFTARAIGTNGSNTFAPTRTTFVTVTPPPTVVKHLYLHPDGTNFTANGQRDLDRFMPVGSTTTLAIADGTTATFDLTPPLALQLGLPTDILARLFIDPISASAPHPDVTVRLMAGTQLLGLRTLNDLNSTLQLYDFVISPLAASVPAGATITLEVSVSGATGDSIDLAFGSAASNSRIELPTWSYIRVNSVATFSAAHPGGIAKSAFDQGDTVSIRTVVSDPFGDYDITAVSCQIRRDGALIATVTPTQVNADASSRTYEIVRNDTIASAISYEATCTANEGSEGTVTHVGSGTWIVSDDDRDDDGLENEFEVANGTDPDDADSDDDGIQDGTELGVGPIGQGTGTGPAFIPDADPTTTTNPNLADHDGDGVSDGIEDTNRNGRVDAGETDPRNADSDGDGINDGIEDTDKDGVVDAGETNPRSGDSDSDGINDGIEDTDKDGIVDPDETNPRTGDTDGDGISDGVEDTDRDGIFELGETNPRNGDTDGDLINDGVEDADKDGVVDANETNPRNADSDGDLISDGVEDADRDGVFEVGETNPRIGDTDGDGISDGIEDADRDGVVDGGETNPRLGDTDGDLISDGVEDADRDGVFETGETDPRLGDTDGDQIGDGIEDADRDGVVDFGETNPRLGDSDGDLIGDGIEDADRDGTFDVGETDPRSADTDLDGIGDGIEDADRDGVFELGETNPRTGDTDGDLINDGIEDTDRDGQFEAGETNPRNADTDLDGISDGIEDLDRDGVVDAAESNPRLDDTDGDLISDGVEDADRDGVYDVGVETNTRSTDTDGDLILDGVEDQDRDGVVDAAESDPRLADTDGDQIADGIEDADRDGVYDAGSETNTRSTDTDGDLIADGIEDLDRDGLVDANETNPRLGDTDGDLLSDGIEDADRDGFYDVGTETNPRAIDTDGDLIGDGIEDLDRDGVVDAAESDPRIGDTDGDLISDGIEDADRDGVYDAGVETSTRSMDTDGDQIADGIEDLDRDGIVDAAETDPRLGDTDGDLLGDGIEDADRDGVYDVGVETNPRATDTDGDLIGDGIEDLDRDGVVDAAESNPRVGDTDGDLISDGIEDADRDGVYDAVAETNTRSTDTDGDSLGDGVEDADRDGLVDALETNPRIADTDGDLLNDGIEVNGTANTNPLDGDSDEDGILDGNEDLDRDGVRDANESDPTDIDTDDDGILDGVERGLTMPQGPDTIGFVGDVDPATTTSAILADTDDDLLADGVEDANHNGRIDALESDPNDGDTDDDFLSDGREILGNNGTSSTDDDSDDDGILDGNEDLDRDGDADANESSPVNPDTDGDGLLDGVEFGLAMPQGSDTGVGFIADGDATSQTLVLDDDSDDDGILDGNEDTDRDGVTEAGELDGAMFDSDGDGLSDGVEIGLALAQGQDTQGFVADADPGTTTDALDDDSDDDGILDGNEDADGAVTLDESDPNAADSDFDGILDGTELGLLVPQGAHTDLSIFVADADASTVTVATDDDTDDDGILDGNEDADRDGMRTAAEIDPLSRDTDGDFVQDGTESGITGPQGVDTNLSLFRADADPLSTTNPLDDDSDDDGLLDGNEDLDRDGAVTAGEIDPLLRDSDADMIGDGIESGLTAPQGVNTDTALFVADADPSTTTIPWDSDTDDGGMPDGDEDVNRDGARVMGERNPLDARDDVDPNVGGSGCGCSLESTSSPRGTILLALAALAALAIRRSVRPERGPKGRVEGAARTIARWGLTPSCSVAMLCASTANAQPVAPAGGFEFQKFQLAPPSDGFAHVRDTKTQDPWRGSISFGATYADQPLGFVANGERVAGIVNGVMRGEAALSFGLRRDLEVWGGLPLTLYQDGAKNFYTKTFVQRDLAVTGINDPRFGAKFRFMDQRDGKPLSMAVIPSMTTPAGFADDLMGSKGPNWGLAVAANRQLGPLRIAGNVGYVAKPAARMSELRVDDEITYGLAAQSQFPWVDRLELRAELFGASVVTDFGDEFASPTEFLVTGRWAHSPTMAIFAGGGAGVGEGYGAPRFRVLGGIHWGIPSKRRAGEVFADVKPDPTPAPTPIAAKEDPKPKATPTPEATPAPTPEATPASTPAPTPQPTPTTVAMVTAPAEWTATGIVCKKVTNNTPLGQTDKFKLDDKRVYVFVEAAGPAPGEIHVVWFKDKLLIEDKVLAVPTTPWKGYANKTLRDDAAKGDWKVEIRDAQKKVLQTVTFRVE